MELRGIIILISFALLLVPVIRIQAKRMKEERIRAIQEPGKHDNPQQEKVKDNGETIEDSFETIMKAILVALGIAFLCIVLFTMALVACIGYFDMLY